MRVGMGVAMRVRVRVIRPVFVVVIVFVLMLVCQVNVKFHPFDSHFLPTRNMKVISLQPEFAQLAFELGGIHP